jgi:putative nucleotidyltransferase with HDIG domain
MTDSDALIHSASDILAQAVALAKNVAIYPPKHPSVLAPAEEMRNLLKRLFPERPRVSFHIVNSEIYVEKQLLRAESLKYSDFLQMMTQRGINSLIFSPDVTPDSLAVFFSLLNDSKETSFSGESLKARMKEQGVTGIDFERLVALDMAKDVYDLVEDKADAALARSSYQEALECMQLIEQDLSSNRTIDVNTLQKAVASLMEEFLSERDAMMGIMGIKSYDEYLFHHSVNVAITSLLIASKLSLDADQMKTVGIGGLMHDIGKLKIPREIMNKPGSLDESEWIVIKRHPIEGAKILMRFETLGELPVLAALEHHAGYDLTGYPALKGKEHPHALACIVGIADVYEAMTANRSYRRAQSVNRAVSVLLEGAGTQFDPLMLKLFFSTVGVFPPGSTVRLKSGELAVVIEPNEDNPFHPKVQIIRPRSANPADSPLINTAEDPSKYAVVSVADSENI